MGLYITIALTLASIASSYWSEQYTRITYAYPYATHPMWTLGAAERVQRAWRERVLDYALSREEP